MLVALLAFLPLASARAVEVADDHLAHFKIEDGAVAQSLTGKPGDPARGRKIAADRGLGNCLSCHALPIPDQADYGNIGPELNGVGARLTEGQLRLRIIDAKRINPATSMPAFYRVDGLIQIAKTVEGKPILTAEQVEDVVAYLASLK
jgi:sulfur-oxidizing protein SoxX